MMSLPAAYRDPIVEAYKKDVYRTLLRENLKLTVDERFRKFKRSMRMVEELQHTGRAARERKHRD